MTDAAKDFITINPSGAITGEFSVPPDKSVSHRSAMLAALAQGTSVIDNYLMSGDCVSTLECLKGLGADIQTDGNRVTIKGNGRESLREPSDVLDAGNSGTTIRLLSGILASLPFTTFITGDGSLRKRPVKRVMTPLSLMGAQFLARQDAFPPMAVKGTRLRGIEYTLPVASAQIKSAILLAALGADGETAIHEPAESRDHTERMFRALSQDIRKEGNTIRIKGGTPIPSFSTRIPGDVSSASFLITAAIMVPGSHITINNIGINPTRMGFVDTLIKMGADITIHSKGENTLGEPEGNIEVKHSRLNAVETGGSDIPLLIDEIPLLAVIAAGAEGKTTVRDAAELRIKESDRIAAIAENMAAMGIKMDEYAEGFSIEGPQKFQGGTINPHSDHRIAMAFAIAALTASSRLRFSFNHR